jgi:hypothetical protein
MAEDDTAEPDLTGTASSTAKPDPDQPPQSPKPDPDNPISHPPRGPDHPQKKG